MCNIAASYPEHSRFAFAHRHTTRLATINTDTSFLPTRLHVIRITAIVTITRIQSSEGRVRFAPVEGREVERIRDADGFTRFGLDIGCHIVISVWFSLD